MGKIKRICVFCGSNSGDSAAFRQAAMALGTTLAQEGIGLVYGGGNVGLMGAVADSVLDAGGTVIGVIPEALVRKEVAHNGLTELRVVKSMHERKFIMAELSDAFIALPGGFGTFEEFFEVITWTQLGIHEKPCALLNVNGYYDSLIKLVDTGVQHNFIKEDNASIIIARPDISTLLSEIKNWQPASGPKWMSKDET